MPTANQVKAISYELARQRKRRRQIIRAEQFGNKYLADANEAAEQGKAKKAERLYAKGQYWLDRYNQLVGNN